MLVQIVVVCVIVAGCCYFARSLLLGYRRARAFEAELRTLSTEEIRGQLVNDVYLINLRADERVDAFLTRLEQGEERAAFDEYSRDGLYQILAYAETMLQGPGRPNAIDTIETIYPLLKELAQRRSA